MKLITKVAILFFFLSGVTYAEISTSLWGTKKSEHFIVYFQEAPLGYVDELLNQAEGYYQSITEELGFTRFSEFWSWDKRAKIYLFKDRQEYQKATGQPQWSGAHTQVIKREIYSYPHMERFFDVVLPHELGHIIFREFIGYKRRLPLWLDEGIASFLEKSQREERLIVAKVLIRTRSFMNLEELGEVKRGLIFMPEVFYAEAASIIEFLLKSYGKDKFVDFCRNLKRLREDQDWTVALFEVYYFKDLKDLDGKWQEFLLK